MVPNGREGGDLFVRLRTLDAYTLLKIEAPVLPFSHETQWQKLWVLQCETKTKGMVLELRYHVEGCMRTFRKTKCIGRAKLTWHELQKAPMLYHDVMFPLSAKRFNSPESKQSCQVGLEVSITPPVQVRLPMTNFY